MIICTWLTDLKQAEITVSKDKNVKNCSIL